MSAATSAGASELEEIDESLCCDERDKNTYRNAKIARVIANAFYCGGDSTVANMLEHAFDELVMLDGATESDFPPSDFIARRYLSRVTSTLMAALELYRREHEELEQARAALRRSSAGGAVVSGRGDA